MYVCITESYVAICRYVCICVHTHSRIFVFTQAQLYIHVVSKNEGIDPYYMYVSLLHTNSPTNNYQHPREATTKYMYK